MSLSSEHFRDLESHWAVAAFRREDRLLAEKAACQRLAERTVGKQIAFAFDHDRQSDDILIRLALAYELAAVEGLDALSRPGDESALREQAMAASSRAFEIRRLLPVPTSTEDRIFFVLQLSALAYCGDRWSDLRRWFRGKRQCALGAICRGRSMGPSTPI